MESDTDISPSGDAEPSLVGADIIRAKLRHLPAGPGVYRMVDDKGQVLYVGKAKSLKKRVASYAKISGLTNRIARMVAATRDLVVIKTHTEAEALLLEANLIKRFKPWFNILLRDDKSFPYIALFGGHEFPQLAKHRGARNRPGDYFGPFASPGSVNDTINTLQKVFLLRSCTDSFFANRTRPCLLHQIKRCSAPCVGRIDAAAYAALVSDAKKFLNGQNPDIQRRLASQMHEAAAAREYELAAAVRDRIQALTRVQSRQDINVQGMGEADVIAGWQAGGQTCVQIFFYRAGQNWGNRAYFPRHDKSEGLADVLGAMIGQFYADKPPPRCILVNAEIEGRELIEQALTAKAGYRVEILRPQRGGKRTLVEQAELNARSELERRMAESASQRALLEKLAEQFGLDSPPRRIEVYDNSHVQGTNAVGAMIVSGPEGLMKSAYRKFNIRSTDLTPGDDFGMMREVFTRRFGRLLREEAESQSGAAADWPDLVVIDGGQGQLSAVQAVFAELGVADVALMAIAKGPDRNAGRERFFLPGQPPISLEPNNPVLYFLQRLRDEAHRFVIGTHRAKRAKAAVKSMLDDVPGIGGARKRALLDHFGTAKAVSAAGLTDLEQVKGISGSVARQIYDHFHGG